MSAAWRSLTAVLVLLSGGLLVAQQDGRQWPPPLVPVSPDASPKSPEASMATFIVPPGYRVELVAAEPLLQDPILTEFDADGRLWVVEMPGYMPELNPSNERERQPDGRIVVLEDTDGDGRMDDRRVFLDGLVLPRALKVLVDGILVAEPPNLWFVKFDAGGNAGDKVLVADSYGRLDAGIEHNENSLWWGFDNWLHTSEGTTHLRRKPDGSFEVRRTLSRGQWGASHDDDGRIYRNTNESVLHVDLVPTPYYQRNARLIRTRGAYETLIGEDRQNNRVWPAHTTPGVNRGYVWNVLAESGALANFTSVSAPTIFRGDRLPPDVYGNAFVVEPAANLVSRLILREEGPGVVARKAYEGAEFLASTDERFRPVWLSPGPDGVLYILDMYRGIIQHRDYITEYLRDQILERDLVEPMGFGRLYRIVHESIEPGPMPRMSSEPSADLVEHLSHPNGWWRDTAQQLLVQRGDMSVVPFLIKLAEHEGDPRTRLHALWTLDGLDQIDERTVRRALEAPDPAIRVAAIRIAERWLRTPGHAMVDVVRARAGDDSQAVRRQLAASLGEVAGPARVEAVADLLAQDGEDPITMDAALSGLAGVEVDVVERLLAAEEQTPAREAAITMLAATVARAGDDEGIARLFALAGETSRPEWQRAAVLAGAEVAWLNARAPGTPAPRPSPQTSEAPCPTCPGGRAGPGGASAFRPGGGGGGRGSGGPAPIQIAAEPVPLVTMASADGPLAARAVRILDRLTWPGKAGAVELEPLSPEEEARFEAGRTVYANLCIACHQANGRGLERVAPSLAGSDLALAPGGIGARILISGKEGETGLMPPLGQALDDEQIAGVLTYIRRQWGNTASPVDPAEVREAREATQDRTRPWTDAEIRALAASEAR